MSERKRKASAQKEGKQQQKQQQPKTRAFKTKWFARAAKKAGISDEELCEAVAELEQGKGENLGGNVWKKRLNENRSRSIVATKPKTFWVFAHLFAKSDQENIEEDELAGFKKLATDYNDGGLDGMEKLAAAGEATEICNDCKDKTDGEEKAKKRGDGSGA